MSKIKFVKLTLIIYFNLVYKKIIISAHDQYENINEIIYILFICNNL